MDIIEKKIQSLYFYGCWNISNSTDLEEMKPIFYYITYYDLVKNYNFLKLLYPNYNNKRFMILNNRTDPNIILLIKRIQLLIDLTKYIDQEQLNNIYNKSVETLIEIYNQKGIFNIAFMRNYEKLTLPPTILNTIKQYI